MESAVSIHSPGPSLCHEPETSDPPSSLSFPSWENLSLNCSKWKDPLTAGPGQSRWGLDSHTVSLSLLYTIPGVSTWAPFLDPPFSSSFQQEPCCLWRCSIHCPPRPSPFVSFILLLFEHPEEKKNVFVLLIVHLFLYFLQLFQCDSCCYLWGAFFFPTFKISLYNSENHGKFLYWNSKPNQADLISK